MPRDAERLILFPSAGAPTADGAHWVLPIHAWVFRPEEDSRRRALLIRLLQKSIGLEDEGLQAELFASRIRPFLVDNLSNRSPTVELYGHRIVLPPTDAGGHTKADLVIPRTIASGAHRIRGWLGDAETDNCSQTVHLNDEHGLSIVSDIDDTIKHSEVSDTTRLLKNTFTRPFETIAGMSEIYRSWAARGACFHYVSSSPWQLFEPLKAMMMASEFPRGSMHLKRFRLKDRSVMGLFQDPRDTKVPIIRSLLRAWPKRRFVLVGDSGEQDPEIYGQIARDHPRRIVAVLIRELTGKGRGEARYRSAFGTMDPLRWQLFTQPSTLDLPH